MFKKTVSRVLNEHKRSRKRFILICLDSWLVVFSIWAAFALRGSTWWPEVYLTNKLPLFLVSIVGCCIFFEILGVYRTVTRYQIPASFSMIFIGIVITALLQYATVSIFGIEKFPRSVPMIFTFVATVLVGGSRAYVSFFLQWLERKTQVNRPLIIYGAGKTGAQIAKFLATEAIYLPVAFVDDAPSKKSTIVAGLPVHSPSDLGDLVKRYNVKDLLIAIPNITSRQKIDVVRSASEYQLSFSTIPPLRDWFRDPSGLNFQKLDVEDLIGRTPIEANKTLLADSIMGNSILVTGAGGSIGSELCRQIINNKPKRLILFENNEYALYAIERELSNAQHNKANPLEIHAVLGNVLNEGLLLDVMEKFAVHTIFHTAAYKHVPIVEENALSALENNVIGTKTTLSAAKKSGVSRFVMISTDKAVRPTNVMGATKRFAELILQDFSTSGSSLICSMVRFGNVIGSSGSVVPKFRDQIEKGGPVTVTQPDVTRYFMTIPEAASLVIQAAALAKAGEVFVLDMGQQIRILDLADTMIRMSGHKPVLPGETAEGMKIVYCGLRPGDKMAEELSIDGKMDRTIHPKIMIVKEDKLASKELQGLIKECENLIKTADKQSAKHLLLKAVREYEVLE